MSCSLFEAKSCFFGTGKGLGIEGVVLGGSGFGSEGLVSKKGPDLWGGVLGSGFSRSGICTG
jgi:hypothetical protein